MATTPTTPTPSVKQYRDYANTQVDEQGILDRYNQLTQQQFGQQRDQNRLAENTYYNQMYNNQLTAMDTIRNSNAQAVQTGASRGVQAANELAAILGMQSENANAATELANTSRQTAQEETAAMLQNILTANQEATRQRETLTQQGYEAESVAATERAAQADAALRERELAQQQQTNLAAINETDPVAYANAVSQQTDLKQYSDSNYGTLQSTLSKLDSSAVGLEQSNFQTWSQAALGWFGPDGREAEAKINDLLGKTEAVISLYGLDKSKYNSIINEIKNTAYNKGNFDFRARDARYSDFLKAYTTLKNNIAIDYQAKAASNK